jgi:hypothetical protein
MHASKFLAAGLLLGGATACGGDKDDFDTSSSDQFILSTQHISDAANTPGTLGFFLLIPLADTTPTFTGTFNPAFKTRLKVEIRDLDCSTFAVGGVHNNLTVVQAYTDQYKLGANVSTLGLVTGNCYRVIPKLDNAQLGFRDHQVTIGTPPTGVKKWTPGSNIVFSWRLEGNMDQDGDGVLNHVDNCPTVANADQADSNSNGIGDACEVHDQDGDGVPDSLDNCPTVSNANQADTDGDHVGDACDACFQDPTKTSPGVCGCGIADTDSDGDGTADCNDSCPSDPGKTAPGACGCGIADTDTDGDGIPNCFDQCPTDSHKTTPGQCGCGTPDTDSDGDGRANCLETCTP